jgi:hypothetical protein
MTILLRVRNGLRRAIALLIVCLMAGCATRPGVGRGVPVEVFASEECWPLSAFQRRLAAGEVVHARVWGGRYVFYSSRTRTGIEALDCAGPFTLAEFTAWLDHADVRWLEVIFVQP